MPRKPTSETENIGAKTVDGEAVATAPDTVSHRYSNSSFPRALADFIDEIDRLTDDMCDQLDSWRERALISEARNRSLVEAATIWKARCLAAEAALDGEEEEGDTW